MNFVLKHSFSGTVVPINPTSRAILGIPADARLGDAPGPIAVALLAVPGPQIPATLAACGDAGVRACEVLTADFAEAGSAGIKRQNELVRIARAHGMRLIGPNCLGFINPGLKLALTSSVAKEGVASFKEKRKPRFRGK